jgi:hypothetical protein
MLGANPAGLFKPLLELLARPMRTHVQVVLADAKARGDRCWVLQVEI